MQNVEMDDTDISTDDEYCCSSSGTSPATTTTTTTPSSSSSTTTTMETTSNEYVLNFAFVSFVGFMSIQAVFAMIANSQAMLADCEAMAVDALTYLFNLWAERAKQMPVILPGKAKEQDMTRQERMYHRELRRLYLELIPPAISCCTLIGITIDTLRDSFATLLGNVDDKDDVSVVIMMIFSLSNLILDIVNVTCFSRSSALFGVDLVLRQHNSAPCSSCTSSTNVADETTPLVMLVVNNGDADDAPTEPPFIGALSKIPLQSFHHHSDLINLNMCSAWTHVCADTLRSTAVLIAAAASFMFPSQLSGSTCDAIAAVAVSFIILGSLLPLLSCLVRTALQIKHMRANPPLSTK